MSYEISPYWALVCPISTKTKKVNVAQTAPSTPLPEASTAMARPFYEVATN